VADVARIIDGPFAGYTGEVISVAEDKVRLKISIFGLPTLVDIPRASVILDEQPPPAAGEG
jgi:transcription antitermination factor NusG